jgi:hypothetical protein
MRSTITTRQDAALHERFYSTWMRPDNPSVNCCNKQDCYPAEFKLVGRTWFAKRREDGQRVPIPEERFEHNRTDRTPVESPDGRSHVCMEPPLGRGCTGITTSTHYR